MENNQIELSETLLVDENQTLFVARIVTGEMCVGLQKKRCLPQIGRLPGGKYHIFFPGKTTTDKLFYHTEIKVPQIDQVVFNSFKNGQMSFSDPFQLIDGSKSKPMDL